MFPAVYRYNKHRIPKNHENLDWQKIQFSCHSTPMGHFWPILHLHIEMTSFKSNHTNVILSTYITYFHGWLNTSSAGLVVGGKGLNAKKWLFVKKRLKKGFFAITCK